MTSPENSNLKPREISRHELECCYYANEERMSRLLNVEWELVISPSGMYVEVTHYGGMTYWRPVYPQPQPF
jgi:hypothetical protein